MTLLLRNQDDHSNYLNGDLSLQTLVTQENPQHRRMGSQTLRKDVSYLKAEGVTPVFAVTGYCFGGRYVSELAFADIIKVAAVAHASPLKVLEHLEKYLAASKVPLLIDSYTVRSQFQLESSATADEIL